MANKWSITKAAVEQVIKFPSKEIFNNYIKKLDSKKYTYEIVYKTLHDDDTLTVVMRKQYNNNEFLSSGEALLQ